MLACNALSTLDICVCVNVDVTVKLEHCINGDANAGNRTEPILCINVCVAIETMLNFDGDAHTDVKCEQALIDCNH